MVVMARFVEISDGKVVNVIAVNDVECLDEFGQVSQLKGQAFLRACNLDSLFILSDTAGIGDVWDGSKFVSEVAE
jgi:hypothetical protein